MGFPFRQFFTTLTVLAPALLPIVPGGALVAPFVPIIIKTIADAQQDPGKTGPEKRAFVQQAVKDGAELANQAKPGTIDVALVVDAAGHYTDAVIGSINAVKQAHDKLPAVPAMIPPTP